MTSAGKFHKTWMTHYQENVMKGFQKLGLDRRKLNMLCLSLSKSILLSCIGVLHAIKSYQEYNILKDLCFY